MAKSPDKPKKPKDPAKPTRAKAAREPLAPIAPALEQSLNPGIARGTAGVGSQTGRTEPAKSNLQQPADNSFERRAYFSAAHKARLSTPQGLGEAPQKGYVANEPSPAAIAPARHKRKSLSPATCTCYKFCIGGRTLLPSVLQAGLLAWLAAMAVLVVFRLLQDQRATTGLLATSTGGEIDPERVAAMAIFPAVLVFYIIQTLNAELPIVDGRPSMPDIPASLVALLMGGNGLYLAGRIARRA